MDDRYKKRGLKFNNTLDSRSLRAVHNQQRQRERRDGVINSRRQIEGIQDSLQVTDSLKMSNGVDKQTELYEKRLERYQKLLKWKEMKKKRLEKEKKMRLPAFKTGVYHPSPPRFLVSEDQNENGKTPHVSLKKIRTPSTSLCKVPVFHLGGTPATSLLRMPQFHTGLTPSMSTKNQTSMVKKHEGQENSGSSYGIRGALENAEGIKTRGKGDAARHCTTHPRKFDKQEDFGMKPLLFTPPGKLPHKKLHKPKLPPQILPSFAPADFAFNFEAPQTSEIERSEHTSTSCTDDPFFLQALEGSLYHSNAKREEEVIRKEDPLMEQRHSVFQENRDGDTSGKGDEDTQSVNKKNLFIQEDNVGCTSDTDEREKSPHKEAFKGSDISRTNKNEMQPDSATLSDEVHGDSLHHKNSVPESTLELLDNEKIDGDLVTSEQKIRCYQMKPEDERSSVSDMNASTSEVQGECESRSKRSRVTTPAKRLTRRSVACCFDGTVTPILSRLRPRTPCTRSTRRSLSAHCDMPHELYTPGRRSARKTPQHSISKAAKSQDPYKVHNVSPVPVLLDNKIIVARSLAHDTEDRMMDAASTLLPQFHLQNTPSGNALNALSQKESCSPLMTPENVFRREQGMWTVETSPWISSKRSKREKLTASDILGVFSDIRGDGSLVPHPVIPSASVSIGTETSLSESTVSTTLLSLLEPSSTKSTESPEMDVWGEESPAISALRNPKTSRERQLREKKAPPEKKNRVPLEMQTNNAEASLSSSANDPIASKHSSVSADLSLFQNGKKKEVTSEKQKSRKSVMFAIMEQENLKTDTYKLPGTPVRKSSRVSMGLFSKVDPSVNGLVIPDQDLIAFDSPMNKENTYCTSRRKSCRVSLLPGMILSPEKKQAVPIPTDLMTWDSPTETKNVSVHSAPTLATPVRRSRRLSKIM